jgi:hypothetical protein
LAKWEEQAVVEEEEAPDQVLAKCEGIAEQLRAVLGQQQGADRRVPKV